MASVPSMELLRQFFVVCPDYGANEGEEHKKLLFYYPKTDSLDVQIQNVGFCEATVKFADTFTNGEAPFHEVNTDKELHVYCSFETKFLIGATFGKSAATERRYFLHGKALYNVILRAYEMFRLFFGTFNDVVDKASTSEPGVGGVDSLKDRLDYFFPRYLSSLRLAPIPLLDAMEWIAYMKLDPTNYLKAQTFVDRTLEAFPRIRHYVFLYNDRLLLHNLSVPSLPCVFRYLVQNLLPISVRFELQPEHSLRSESSLSNHGKFLTGPTNSALESGSASDGIKLPSVFLLRDNESGEPSGRNGVGCLLDEYYLIVYRALNATLAMLVSVRDSASLNLDFFQNLDAAIGLQLTSLASNFVDLYGKEREEVGFSSHHYIYYNSVNLALTTTLNEQPPFDSKSSSGSVAQGIPLELAAVLCDFRDKICESEYFGDIMAKADGDYWVASKKSGARELYTVTYQKNANLTDVHEEIKRFCNSVFDNVFFFLINLLLLNMILGIIVDTFKQLREENFLYENDKANVCFICGLDKLKMKSFGIDFEEHIKKDHNLWSYAYFFINLQYLEGEDKNSFELYIYSMLKSDNYSFFPENVCYAIKNKLENK